MKSVLISIKPKWCNLISSGKKTIEIRKTRPKLETPFKCFIYCTKDATEKFWSSNALMVPYKYVDDHSHNMFDTQINGNVMGEFVCDNIDTYDDDAIYAHSHEDYAKWEDMDIYSCCVHPEDFERYANDKWLYGWHISDLVIYDKPKELREFTIVDKDTVKKCAWRSRTGQAEDIAKHGGWLKGSWTCDIDGETNWCINCKTKPLNRPPQSWCYVDVPI